MNDTLLELSGPGIPKWSARGLKQGFAPDVDAQMERDVNGTLHAIEIPAAFHKLRVSITAEDIQPPAFGNLKKGDLVTVTCAAELGEPATLTAGSASITLSRPAVGGSGRAVAASGALAAVALTGTDNKTASVDFGDAGLSGYCAIYYRPVLSCRVENFSMDRDEWSAASSWLLELREV
ncbi:MAG TPA: hypothetical protein DCW68_02585 [Rhodospirillaceae bacterium]|nr:MAG: hypothetical protein A2018_05560 [Alphaproteobacteria bacterium GWF2_58_20]HAU28981.1 hypothetical protein [Rhodospirillaceae bacterium]